MANEKEEGGPEEKLCIDEIPDDIKKIIISSIGLCGRISDWTEKTMDRSVSDRETCESAYNVALGARELYLLLHKTFGWEDISKMMDDIGMRDEPLDLSNKINMPSGSVVHIDSSVLDALKKEEKNA